MKRLTIFTPTYNRAYCLDRCYESLCKQSCFDFVWMIIDDGSTDNTRELVQSWILKNTPFEVIYKRKNNQGKQMAHNLAVSMCDTELFMCVDSDDYLTTNAVECVLKLWDKYKNDSYSGIIALRGSEENTVLGTKMPTGVLSASLIELYEKYKFKGDTALVYRTDILKQFPFILENNEKFIGENFVYDQIDQKYKMILYNDIIYICQYLEDGYTKNTISLLKANPYSYMKMKKQSSHISRHFFMKIKHMAGYIAMALYIKKRNIIRDSGNILLAIVSFPLGIVIYNIRFREN